MVLNLILYTQTLGHGVFKSSITQTLGHGVIITKLTQANSLREVLLS